MAIAASGTGGNVVNELVQAGAEPGMRRYKRYAEYKDSGVEWLGEIPRHWEVRRTKHVARLESGHTPSRQHPEYWVDCIVPWFGLADVWQIRDGLREYVSETNEKISELGLANSSARLLPKGTVILSRTASVGFSAIMGTAMATTQDFVNWVCGPKVRPEYLLYVLRTMAPDFKRLIMGSTHQTIYMPDVSRFSTPVPSLHEQDCAVSFIRHETAKIDALIGKKERLIELLQEKRMALITRAVTKGLDPTVPMKDSGVEWLGEIPAHWDLVALSRFLHRITYGFTNPMPVTDDGPYMLTANDIGDGHIRYEDARRTSRRAFDVALTDKSRPISGDILLTKDGTLGRTAIADGQEICINQSVALLRLNQTLVDVGFVHNALRAAAYQERMIFEAGGTTIKHIYISRLAKMPIACPPQSEQRDISEHVSRSRKVIDNLTLRIKDGIDRLKEYRTALISAAVTGKIDVRDELPP